MAEAKKPAKKIIDVAHPGQSAPSTNSKSVIITHRPAVQDPMVTAQTTGDETTAESVPVMTPSKHTVLQPLGDSPKPEPEAKPESTPKPETEANAEPEVAEPEVAEPEVEETKPEDEAEKPAEPVEPADAPEPEKSVPDVAATEAKVGTKDVQTEAEAAAEEEAEAEREAKLQELVDNKTYYLPIVTSETRQARQFVAVGVLLSIILIAAWVDVALDAGLIHLGNLHALTHFFN